MSNSTCVVSSCERVASHHKYCPGHAARLHRLGDVQADKPLRSRKPATKRPADGRPQCTVEGCEKLARSRTSDLCAMHYHRLYRGTALGDAEQRKRSKRNAECAVDGCDGPDRETGFCAMHAARIRRNGDPHTVIPVEDRKRYFGEEHHNWVGDELKYSAAHARVKRQFGPASDHGCVDCSEQATHWSYNHTDPDERTGWTCGYLLAWSANVEHYSPRCVPCHKRFDLDHIGNSSKRHFYVG